MATITKTYTENQSGSNKATWTFNATGQAQTLSANGSIAAPSLTGKFVFSGKNKGQCQIGARLRIGSSQYVGEIFYSKPADYSYTPVSMTSGTTYTITAVSKESMTVNLSTFFTSSNPTVKTLDVYFCSRYVQAESLKSDGTLANHYADDTSTVWGKIGTLTLNAPPTFTASATTSAPYYQYGTPYTVNVSNLSAKYGGSISEVKLTIGSQSATRSGNGTITITPNKAGTFTPQVKVTDSRGQVTTKSLSSITVIGTSVGITSFNVDRINSTTFLLDDEGTNALVTAVINYTEFAGNDLTQPTLKKNGTETNNVTWYTSWDNVNGFSSPVNWTNYAPTSPITLYAKVTDTFAQNNSYTLSIIGESTYATSGTYTATLSQAFFLLVGRAGGKGLGIGRKPYSDNLCIGNMNAYLEKATDPAAGVFYSAKDITTNTQIELGIGTNGTNHGVYSDTLGSWLLYTDGSNIYVGSTVINISTGEVTIMGHGSPIGWYDGHNDTTSIASGTNFASVSNSGITLTQGRYILTASATFAGNATGYRGVGFYKSGVINEGSAIQPCIPSASWTTRVSTSLIRNVSSTETISLALLQNSGSALSTEWYIKAIRIR